MRTPEILAPVGSKEGLRFAIAGGADAIYLAGLKFGARAYADNFSEEELSDAIKLSHLYGVKVYVTVNTVFFENEIEEVLAFIDFLYKNDCDAVIIQDIGLLNLLLHQYPDFNIHISTQMNTISFSQAKVFAEMGVKRIIVAREMPLLTIRKIKSELNIEVEVFIHGALCISYSGNCYMSSFNGSRSGNRGRCAQPCRLLYSFDKKDYQYYLSPKDLMTLDDIDKLIECGVDSFKIEGRMKRKEYVAEVVKAYKSVMNKTVSDSRLSKEKLKLIYNREFTKSFMFGDGNHEYTNTITSNHIGVRIGSVISERGNMITIKLTGEVCQGDSIRIVGEKTDAITINQMKVNGEYACYAKCQNIEVRAHITGLVGALCYITTSVRQIEELNELELPKIKIWGEISLENKHLKLTITDGFHEVSCISSERFVESTSNYNDRIIEQINRSRELFVFEDLNITFANHVFLPVRAINELRRNTFNSLKRARERKYHMRQSKNTSDIKCSFRNRFNNEIVVQIKTEGQLMAALDNNIKTIYVADYRLYTELVGKYTDITLFYVPPRIYSLNMPNLVTASIANVNGNVSSVYMNVVNSYAIAILLEKGALSVGLSIELTGKQIKSILESFHKRYHFLPNVEIIAYGRYELMVMKHCFINKAVNQKKMGCLKCQEYNKLYNEKGRPFFLVKEENCNLKILTDEKVNLLNHTGELLENGVNRFILNFTDEEKSETDGVIKMYADVLKGKKSLKTGTNGMDGHFKDGVI